jgi:S-adenosylmethionine-diacylglycerol 3-amino-3-carboxypropyl transferase
MKTEIEQQAAFNIMRYAQCWEDADVLIKALDIQPDDVCVSIASAGENSFSILSKSPKKVIALDMNPVQLAAVELRKAVYAHLSHEEMLKFHGAREASREERYEYYNRVKPFLSEDVIAYWTQTNFLTVGYGAIGKFEKYFGLFKDKVIPFIHSKKTIEKLFAIETIEEQREFYKSKWNNWRWRLLFKVFFSRKFMGLMGRDPAFFKYVEGSVAEKILSRTEVAFNQVLAKDNPYLDWILHGEFKHALPHALREENFEAIRQNLHKLETHLGSIESYLEKSPEKITKYNLSDIFEYMSEEMYEKLMQQLINASTTGGRIAYWNMLAPRFSGLSKPLVVQLETLNTDELFLKDKAFFYSKFICEKIK